MSAATDTVLRQRVSKEKVEKFKVKKSASSPITYVRPNDFEKLPEYDYSAKRLMDLVVGSVALIGFVMLYPVIAIGIKLTSKGPVLFKQPRTGKNGNIFFCYKFRTMHVVHKKAVNGQPVVTQKGDNRIFTFGQFLRKTNLDELPQILNVIKGDMSLVGPRPYPVEECAYWNQKFEDHYYRYILKPGITGFAQAQGYRGGTLDEELMRKRLDFDLIYVEKSTFAFDLRIIYKTVKRMVVRETNGH